MSHLGDRITALVDGELGHDERDRVLAHLAACEPCRAEADVQRRLKQRLSSLGDAAPSPELLTRLYAMGEPGGPIPPRARPMPGAAKPPVVARPSAHRPGRARSTGRATRRGLKSGVGGHGIDPGHGTDPGHGIGPERGASRAGRRVPRMRYLAVGAATLAVFGIGTAGFVAGGDQGRLPRVAPALDQFAVEHALTSGDVPVTDRDPAEGSTSRP
ncbi:MAG TPA: zf-HC2 domain-containing protein [Streptosporangiaceae bacterium]|nr:zf-HC2 domain-containing protein [Streptosporangiaceae bacterium]